MSHIVHRSLREAPPVAVSGSGIMLRDASGHEVIDGSGGAAVACLGHGHPRVVAAMKAQIDRLCYAHTAIFSAESAERLADMLTSLHMTRGLVHRCARRRAEGTETHADVAMAKLAATEAAARACEEAVMLHGARGYSSAYVPERLLRDIHALRIYEGASLIQKTLLARALTTKPR